LQPHELFAVFTTRLEQAGVAYFVTGSVASLLYGDPRMTHDVDLVLALRDAEVSRFEAVFPEEEFYRPPTEVIRVELRRPTHGHFNLIHHDTGFKADIYLLSTQPLHAWAMQQRRRVGTGDDAFWVAPPEYVIVRKLEYFRDGGSEKHLRDIRGVIATLGDSLDLATVERWVDTLGLRATWERAASR